MKYIALIRGVFSVNAPNKKLVALFARLGFVDIQTIGASGNLLFTADETNTAKLEQMIEESLRGLLGDNALVIVRTDKQIEALVEHAPFKGKSHTPATYLTVTFFKHTQTNPTSSTSMVHYSSDANALCLINDNTVKPHFMTRIEREYGKQNTTRTWNVVMKIANKLNES